MTDSRYEGYIVKYGDESWELDALEPRVLRDLVRTEVTRVIVKDKWEDRTRTEDRDKDLLEKVSTRWEEVVELLED